MFGKAELTNSGTYDTGNLIVVDLLSDEDSVAPSTDQASQRSTSPFESLIAKLPWIEDRADPSTSIFQPRHSLTRSSSHNHSIVDSITASVSEIHPVPATPNAGPSNVFHTNLRRTAEPLNTGIFGGLKRNHDDAEGFEVTSKKMKTYTFQPLKNENSMIGHEVGLEQNLDGARQDTMGAEVAKLSRESLTEAVRSPETIPSPIAVLSSSNALDFIPLESPAATPKVPTTSQTGREATPDSLFMKKPVREIEPFLNRPSSSKAAADNHEVQTEKTPASLEQLDHHSTTAGSPAAELIRNNTAPQANIKGETTTQVEGGAKSPPMFLKQESVEPPGDRPAQQNSSGTQRKQSVPKPSSDLGTVGRQSATQSANPISGVPPTAPTGPRATNLDGRLAIRSQSPQQVQSSARNPPLVRCVDCGMKYDPQANSKGSKKCLRHPCKFLSQLTKAQLGGFLGFFAPLE